MILFFFFVGMWWLFAATQQGAQGLERWLSGQWWWLCGFQCRVLSVSWLCQNRMYEAIVRIWCWHWAHCCCRDRTPSSPSGPWQSSCKQQASTPKPKGRRNRAWLSFPVEKRGLQRSECHSASGEIKSDWLTPTFRSKSLTMLSADILAEGVNGELLP